MTTVACIGDSITAGHNWPGEAYPVYLSQNLGKSFTVKNYGINGVSITELSPNSYTSFIDTTNYTNSINAKPDVVIFILGTNDSKVWAEAKSDYKSMYIELIQSYKDSNPNVKIILVTSPPTKDNSFGIDNTVIGGELRDVQLEIASELGPKLVDANKVFNEYEGGIDALLRDGDNVHLSVKGAQLMAGRGEVENAPSVPVGHGYEFRAVSDRTLP